MGIDKAGLEDILGVAQHRRFPAGHEITTGGGRASTLYLIQSGRARLYHLTKAGELVLLAWLVPGDVAGLATSLKIPHAYMATAESTCDCEVLAWEHLVVRKLFSRYPVLAENALHIALEHLRTYIDRHVALVTKNAEARLAETLLRLSEQTGEFHPQGIEIRATNDELAAFAGISSFTASRVLSSWDRAGTLSKARGRILLQDPEALMVD
jgi:CRP-like cAMP-binding protein